MGACVVERESENDTDTEIYVCVYHRTGGGLKRCSDRVCMREEKSEEREREREMCDM